MTEIIYLSFGIISCIIISIFCILKPSLERSEGSKEGVASKIHQTTGGLKTTGSFKIPEIPAKFIIIILAALSAVFIFSRLFRLDTIPAGMHLDEIGISYDAFCLKSFGTDRFGRRYPVYPTNYGDGNSPLYTYMLMLLLEIFPWSVTITRLPAFICGLFCFFFSYLLIYELYKSRTAALLGPLLVTIIPYFFASERWGLDCNLMLSLLTVAMYFLIRAVNKDTISSYVLAGCFMGLTLYTYVLSYIILPVFLMLTFIYLLIIKKTDIKKALFCAIPFVILAIPLLLEQLVNIGLIPEFSLLFSDFRRLNSYRSSEFSLSNIPGNIGLIYHCLIRDGIFSYNCFNEFGPVYLCLIPLLIAGIISGGRKALNALKNHKYDHFVPVFMLGFIIYFVRMLIATPDNIYKINSIFLVFLIFIAEGTLWLFECLNYGKKGWFICIATVLITGVTFLLFSEFYFRRQTAVYGLHPVFISTIPGDIVKYAKDVYDPENNKNIYVELEYRNRDYSDIAIALINQMDPEIYMEHVNNETNELDNIHFYFPEEFNEDEEAVYILGSNWGHITAYLKSIGFNCDENWPGYAILYR